MAADDQNREGVPRPAHDKAVHARTQRDVIQQSQPNIPGVDQNGNSVTASAAVQAQPIIKYIDQNGNPVDPPVDGKQIIKYIDQNGNPVAAPTAIQAQPQPIIKYIDQNGNPVAPPVDGPQIIKYFDQNGNRVAPPINATVVINQQSSQQPQQMVVIQPQQFMVDPPNDTNYLKQQFAQRPGNCLKSLLLIFWSMAIFGGLLQSIIGVLIVHFGTCEAACTLSLLLPGIVAILSGWISLYGVDRYNYPLCIVSCIASGVLLFFGILLLMVEHGVPWFLAAYTIPMTGYLCLFAFSIAFTKHLAFVKEHGHPNPGHCCCVCVPSPNQPAVYQQPGVALQIEVASQPHKEGVSTGIQQSDASGPVDVYEQNVNSANHINVVSKAMMTNGGYCWKVTLIALWSCVLVNALPQFIVGCIFVSLASGDFVAVWTWSLFIPGLIAFISAPISIYGVSKYNYKLNIFSCIILG